MYPISQLIVPLNNNNNFSFKLKNRFYCFDCLKDDTKLEYFGPIINVLKEDLELSLNDVLSKKFQNLAFVCPICGWCD